MCLKFVENNVRSVMPLSFVPGRHLADQCHLCPTAGGPDCAMCMVRINIDNRCALSMPIATDIYLLAPFVTSITIMTLIMSWPMGMEKGRLSTVK